MPATKNKVNCSVCGMDVDRDSKRKADYKGQTYYFCSDSDKKEFQKRPQVYAGMQRVSKTTKKAA
ncbi:MAG TPA: YHS domain-containing protein [Nitrospirota bacterium]